MTKTDEGLTQTEKRVGDRIYVTINSLGNRVYVKYVEADGRFVEHQESTQQTETNPGGSILAKQEKRDIPDEPAVMKNAIQDRGM